MLRTTRMQGADIKVISDCNSVFIGHILAGARAAEHIAEIITNPAAFELVSAAEASHTSAALGGARGSSPGPVRPGGALGGHRLVIRPHTASHSCPLCPSNLCKGALVRSMRRAGTYRSIVFAGDGYNDVCAALALGPGDVVLAREGHGLADFLAKPSGRRVRATVHTWGTHAELAAHVQRLVGQRAAWK